MSNKRIRQAMVQIQLEDHVAAALKSQAREQGLSLEAYLAGIAASEPAPARPRLSADEVICLIESEAGPGNGAYQGTFSREDIYIDHD